MKVMHERSRVELDQSIYHQLIDWLIDCEKKDA